MLTQVGFGFVNRMEWCGQVDRGYSFILDFFWVICDMDIDFRFVKEFVIVEVFVIVKFWRG